LMGTEGTCVEVDTTSWEVGRVLSVDIEQGTAQESVLAPGGRFLWTKAVRDGWWTPIQVYDTERDAYVRNSSESVRRLSIRPLTGLAEPRVVVGRDRGAVSVFEARGAPLGATQDKLPLLPRSVVVHPSGKGLFAFLRQNVDEERTRVRWVELAL